MSRSGYTEIDDGEFCPYRGSVARALRGKRGQAALVKIAEALDAMPVKGLAKGSFQKDCNPCTLGALAASLGIDMIDVEPAVDEYGVDDVDAVKVGKRLNIAPAMAREIMYENDDCYGTPQERWEYMRKWVAREIREVK